MNRICFLTSVLYINKPRFLDASNIQFAPRDRNAIASRFWRNSFGYGDCDDE